MIEALQKQNQLFRGYIATLERENEARNVQRNTLFNEIDRLTAENQSLTRQRSIVSPKLTSSNHNGLIEKELKYHKDSNIALTAQVSSLKNQISQLTNDLKNRQKQRNRLLEEKQSDSMEIQFLRNTLNKLSLQRSEITILQNEINTYKAKLSQIGTLQQSLRASNNRISELQALNRKLEYDLKKVDENYKRIQGDYKRLENENRDIKVNGKSVTEISSLMSIKLNLQATIRQLNGKIEWLETNNKSTESQKLQFERKWREVERQLLQIKGKLMQFKMRQQSNKNSQANMQLKEKEMEALEQAITNLKQNKKYLQKSIKEKDQTIVSLQSELNSCQTSKFDNDQALRQINNLQNQKIQLQKQIYTIMKTNQDLQLYVSGFSQKEKTLIMEINQFKDEKYKKREGQNPNYNYSPRISKSRVNDYSSHQRSLHLYSIPERDANSGQQDLRTEIKKLRSQIDELKSLPQFKSQPGSEIQPPTSRQSSEFLNIKSFVQKREKSPQERPKYFASSDKEKKVVNRQKWQNLQSKISALRNQNESLKKSLFD